MKNTNYLLMAVFAVLMVVTVGCTTMRDAQDDGYYDRNTAGRTPARIYMEDPYNYGRTIILQQDPVTGRYFQLGPWGNYGYSAFDNGGFYDPYFDNRRFGNRRFNGPVHQQPQGPSAQERREGEQRRQDAKNAILGKRQ